MAKKVWFSMTTHPNMNYDRSLRSVIWEEFPKLYRLYLNYVQDNPPVKSHMQLPPQTLLSLKQCAPDVLEQAQALRAEGRVKFMGTFFSESIAQCQDGMTLLDAAHLGCDIAAQELGADLEGFFLQEIAYTPQLPYLVNRLGVQWTIIRDWDDGLKPFWAEGLDGSRCLAVPLLEHAQREGIRRNPERIPADALLVTHCDMEIPVAIQVMHDLERFLREECGFETEWCFVSEYVHKVGVHEVKHPTVCTNKPEDSPASPSFSRWCSDHLSMQVHHAALDAMESRRAACLTTCGRRPAGVRLPRIPKTRPYTTWDVENPWLYPELNEWVGGELAGSAFRRMSLLLAWGTNSDGRGWYPMLERRVERTDSFAECKALADAVVRGCGAPTSGAPGLLVVNPHGVVAPGWYTVEAEEPLAFLDEHGHDLVHALRRAGTGWEHQVRVEAEPYSLAGLRRAPAMRQPLVEEPGCRLPGDRMTAEFAGGVLTLTPADRPPLTLALDPFRLYVKCLDEELRDPDPEGDWRVTIVPGRFPRLIVRRQIDYHVHFQAEYTLDGDRLFADWRFWFTYPTLVDSLDDFDAGGPKTDFTPGGLCASLTTGAPGQVWYDVPFGVVQHPNPDESFVPPLTHAFLVHPDGGVALISRSGSQSFKVHAAAGRVGVCLGKSITSGGRRKLLHWSGDRIDDFGCDTDWYKEFFFGELRHQFVVLPFAGDWRECALPNLCRALAHGPRILETHALPETGQRLAELEPANVRLVGLEPDSGRIVLCEMCGRPADYSLHLAGRVFTGRLGPFEIRELR